MASQSVMRALDYTGGWQVWQTIDLPVSLNEGRQTLRVAFSRENASANDFLLNINWIDIQKTADESSGSMWIPIIDRNGKVMMIEF